VNARDPGYLFFLLFLIPIILAALRGYKQGRVSRERLTGMRDGESSAGVFGGWFFVRIFLGALLFCAFFVFSVLALADISWGTAPEPEDRSGLDIVVTLDVSRSMLAPDNQPSRLRAAAGIAQGLVQSLPHSRFAVVAFKGASIIAVPMTEDRQILETFFQDVSPSVVSSPGSSLEAGMELALNAFPQGNPSHRAIVLLSDGESLQTFSTRSAEKAGEAGVPVFCIGMGGAEGSVIRLEGAGLVTRRDGTPVVTRQNAQVLKTISDVSQGEYFSSREPGVVSRLARKLQDFEESRGKMGFRLVPVRRYRSFLLAGFLLLCASVLVRSGKWKKA
jgi:Ca-activated chloride channel family protein